MTRRITGLLLLTVALVAGRVGTAEASSILYATSTRIGAGSGPGGLFSVDAYTGATQMLFELPFFAHGGGLAYDPVTDLLYATGYDFNSQSGLWSINRHTGVTTLIGYTGAGIQYGDLTIDPLTGTMYAVGDNFMQSTAFYTVSKTTGLATYVGQASGQFTRLYGMGYGCNGTLYGNGWSNPFTQHSELYTINPSTGATTTIGLTGVTVSRGTGYSGIAARDDCALLSLGSTSASTTGLYTLNPLTGQATLIGQTVGLGSDGGLVYVPAPGTPVPEPGTLLLVGLGAVALAGRHVTRRRRR